jgi:predicted HTH domain antitoxin
MDRHIYNQQQINICMEQMFENGAIILGKIVEILGHQTKELV